MKKIRVLLIDDDEDDYFLTKGLFAKLSNSDDYELSWISTFDQGINAILKHQFDVYLVDYRLGKESGIQILKEAVAYQVLEPIIILTGKGDFKIDREANLLGAADYLVKDKINPDSLERSIRYALKHSQNLKTIAESERNFRVVFDKAKSPILISDVTGKIYNLNKAGYDFFEIQSNTGLGSLNDRNFFRFQEDRESFIDVLESKGTVTDFECEMVSSNGSVYFCSLSSSVQMDTKNMIEVYYTLIHDLSYRREQEAKIVNKDKAQLSEHIAKGFAEEIRNPLSTINLLLYELIEDETLVQNETAQENIGIIRSNLDYINQLIKKFISSTEVSNLDFKTTNIYPIISKALDNISDIIYGQRVELQTFLLPHNVELNIDAEQINIVITNILMNAIENMTEFPKVLTVSSMSDSGFYSILIEDNGKQLDPKIENRIFEPFFSTKKDAKGLGLTEANRIVMAHNGQINYKAQDNGNLFIIQLPIG